ncbi:MAG TPA: phosphatase PAP2 family protein [Gaiellaceae bacterium]|nr:phosphatase PAP2 family protein [Gaiellaceae bacterium]
MILDRDRHLERWIVDHRVSWLNWPFEQLSRIGTWGLVWLAIALVLALLWRRPAVFVLVLAADAIAELLQTLLKAAIPRARPHVSHLIPVPSSHSFPSGHAATSFACATVLCALAPRFRAWFIALAAAIAYSRLYNGVHYPLDVVGGAVLGVLAGVTALRLPAGRHRRSRRGLRAG